MNWLEAQMNWSEIEVRRSKIKVTTRPNVVKIYLFKNLPFRHRHTSQHFTNEDILFCCFVDSFYLYYFNVCSFTM